jgi:hypothetical protein
MLENNGDKCPLIGEVYVTMLENNGDKCPLIGEVYATIIVKRILEIRL